MGMRHTSLMDAGLISMTVPSRVSTNWDMCRSVSLIRTANSSITILYNNSSIADAGGMGMRLVCCHGNEIDSL